MENQTGFNLNAALAKWRTEVLESQPGVSSDITRELESHLRDSVADLHGKGLSEEEAFWLARRRLGAPKKLVAEFTKADPAILWSERVFWMVAGVFAMNVFSTIAYAPFSFRSVGPTGRFPLELMVVILALCYGLIAGLALVVAKGRLPKSLSTLSKMFNSSRRLFGFVALMTFIQLIPSFVLIWDLSAKSGRLELMGGGNVGLMLIKLLWPFIICYLLVYLRRQVSRA